MSASIRVWNACSSGGMSASPLTVLTPVSTICAYMEILLARLSRDPRTVAMLPPCRRNGLPASSRNDTLRSLYLQILYHDLFASRGLHAQSRLARTRLESSYPALDRARARRSAAAGLLAHHHRLGR